MSFKYARAGVYRCDQCGAKQLAPDGELPEGWGTDVRHYPGAQDWPADVVHTEHYCPKCCVPPEVK